MNVKIIQELVLILIDWARYTELLGFSLDKIFMKIFVDLFYLGSFCGLSFQSVENFSWDDFWNVKKTHPSWFDLVIDFENPTMDVRVFAD